MKNMLLAACACLALASSARADVVVVLSDPARNVLIQLLAAGLQAQPQLSPQAVYLLNLINTAPVMTSQQEIKPDPPKAPATPSSAAKDETTP